ncbi:MAG TPA: high-affinity nickel-transport family protein [Methylomirabilota bacterium]|nr:high-affinity nickel-transport family protein [Methylomirabilota bacterium]
MDPVVSAVALGFVLGLQHATDADHLVAVATIASRERRFIDGALVGAFWGLGHMTTLGVAGAIVIAFGLRVSAGLATGLELVVAAMLVALGVLRLRDAARGAADVPPEHLLADHDHGGAEVVHSHSHDHADAAHAHPHVHPSRRLLDVLGGGRAGLAGRAAMVGAVHGMAGSAAVTLLVLATLPTAAAGVVYLVVFGAGTLAGMTALTAVMAWPVALALRLRRARRLLAVGTGCASIAFGLLYGASAL